MVRTRLNLFAIVTSFISKAASQVCEQGTYLPFSAAMNYAFECLSEIEVDGLPKFRNHIAFVPCQERAIQSNRTTPGSLFKPDIAVMSIQDAYEFYEPGRSDAQKRKPCELMNEIARKTPSGSASWSTVLSVVEIKRSNAIWTTPEAGDDKGKQINPTGNLNELLGEELDDSQQTTCKIRLSQQDFTLTPVAQRCHPQL